MVAKVITTIRNLFSSRVLSVAEKNSIKTYPRVDIDDSGIFKYILIKVYDNEGKRKEDSVIVRGFKRHEWHGDILKEVQERLQPYTCEPLGGGQIHHQPEKNLINIYGSSLDFGPADHVIAAKLIKETYPNYTIIIVDLDPTGEFKYVLLRVYDLVGRRDEIIVVKGTKKHEWHNNIFDEVQGKLEPYKCDPLGGGKVNHQAEDKQIRVYGKSSVYGPADHEYTASLIREAFPEYDVLVGDPPKKKF